jgi:hypothetical protein
VLEPEVRLERALQMAPLMMVALGDCIGSLAPPKVAIHYRWPNGILLNGSMAGEVRLGAPNVPADAIPDWLVTITTRTPTPTPLPTGAIDVGPVSAVAGDCPYLDVPTAQDEEGNRIGATVVLRAGGRTVGCRFSYYYDGHPVLEITSARFRSATLAYNAMVRLGQSGTHQIPVHDLMPGVDGVLYQTAFNPPDERLDWACSFATGDTVVTVKTDQKNVSFNARNIAKTIAPKF